MDMFFLTIFNLVMMFDFVICKLGPCEPPKTTEPYYELNKGNSLMVKISIQSEVDIIFNSKFY